MIQNNRLVNPEVRIETINMCNANCVICPRESMTREKTSMLMFQFQDIIDQVMDLGAQKISLFGFGEPLLDREIRKKIRYCANRKLETFLTTNGSLLDRDATHMLSDNGLTHIRFSVHGLTKENYEAVHRYLDYDEVMRNIELFLELNHFITTHMSVIPMHGETVKEIRLRWEKKVNFLEIWRPHNWVDGRNYREVKVRKVTCGRPFNGPLQILADGRMQVCCFDFDGKIIIGDTAKTEIIDILNGPALRGIQVAHITGEYGKLICSSCDQLNEETESPLLYSNRDPERQIGITSTFKTKVDAA